MVSSYGALANERRGPLGCRASSPRRFPSEVVRTGLEVLEERGPRGTANEQRQPVLGAAANVVWPRRAVGQRTNALHAAKVRGRPAAEVINELADRELARGIVVDVDCGRGSTTAHLGYAFLRLVARSQQKWLGYGERGFVGPGRWPGEVRERPHPAGTGTCRGAVRCRGNRDRCAPGVSGGGAVFANRRGGPCWRPISQSSCRRAS